MAVAGEKITLLTMRDSGETRRFRMRRSWLRTIITFLLICPFVAGGALWLAFTFWQEHAHLEMQYLRLQNEAESLKITVERLSTAEQLLSRTKDLTSRLENTLFGDAGPKPVPDIPPKLAAEKTTPATDEQTTTPLSDEQEKLEEGPGHDEFPVVDLKKISIENVSSSRIDAGRLRTTLDLRNSGDESVSGNVNCLLALASGEVVPLETTPADASSFRILRWKKAVLISPIPSGHDLFNAQLIIEVKNQEGELWYRNSYPIGQ